MFTNFHIERFRGIPALDIDGVKPFTLLVGKNNSGKTSVLEAIFLLCGATNPYMPTLVAKMRGQRITTAQEAHTAWQSLFHGMTWSEASVISGVRQGEGERRGVRQGEESRRGIRQGRERCLKLSALPDLTYPDDSERQEGAVGTGFEPRIGTLMLEFTSAHHTDPVHTRAYFDRAKRILVSASRQQEDFIRGTLLSARSFFDPVRDTEQYSSLVRTRREKGIIDSLRLIDPRIQRLVVVTEGSGATVYADTGSEALIPLAVCGEGMLRLFTISLAVTASEGGVLLIDEIDNGLHHSVMKELWPVLRKLCAEHNVQLIATTHSDEMLRHALTTFRDDYSSFNLIRLDRVPNGMRAVTYNADAMEGALETNWEVRG